jgi:hypothetical protein
VVKRSTSAAAPITRDQEDCGDQKD